MINKDEIIKWAYNNCNLGGEIDLTEFTAYLLNIKIYNKNGRTILKNYNKVWEYIFSLKNDGDKNENNN